MSAEVLFARPDVLEEMRPAERSVWTGWNPEDFAREQIRGLVRRVFLSKVERRVRQVMLSALEPETDVRSLCRRVGEALALETEENVGVVGMYPRVAPGAQAYREEATQHAGQDATTPLRQVATRVQNNLWLVPAAGNDRDRGGTAALHSYLGEVRSVFEYSIVEGPPAGESNQAMATAQFADGIILVLSAQRTRRIAARRIKEMLESAEVRILGTVLIDRVFPIPEAIYRRL